MEAKIREIQLKGSAKKVLDMSNLAESKYLDVQGRWWKMGRESDLC